MLRTNSENILVIPDLQIPYHHKDAFRFLKDVENDFGCDSVVCVGDEVDQYSLSKYSHDPDAPSAGDEYRTSIKYLRNLYELFPEAKVCLSNHTDRVVKRAIEAGIPRGYMRSIRQFMEAPDEWTWAKKWNIGGINFEHGDGIGGTTPHRTLAISNHQSTVIGHHHSSAGVEYISNGDCLLFGMNVGCLVDIESFAFAYAQNARYKPILSCGVILEGVPHLEPMLTKKSGRYLYA